MHSILKHLKQCGPGAIVASATIGAGETVLAVRMGAWGGYELLWLILLAVICKSFLTLYLLGRYSAVSGEAVADRLIELPGPRGWLLWILLILEGLVAPLVFVVIAVPCGLLMSNILATIGMMISYKWLALGFVSLAIIVGHHCSGRSDQSHVTDCDPRSDWEIYGVGDHRPQTTDS